MDELSSLQRKSFLNGLMAGATLGVTFMAILWLISANQSSDRDDRPGAENAQNVRLLDKTSAAYIESHGGVLPKGKPEQSDGDVLVVVGFDASK
ncbi:hypothetical protein FACS189475_04980 [Betaproteobacteria bacterium]|nr:hypothetical protein FACS189475_04980 [Betaproteobacteria bacterium]